MLDDDAGRRVELAHALERRIAVGDVVEGQLLALDLLSLRHRGADGAGIGVERRLLMRVLAIAQIKLLAEREIQIVGESRRRAADRAGEVRGHHGVVLRGMRERLGREFLPHRNAGRALRGRQIVEQRAVIAGIDDHGDVGVVLGRRPHHGRTADVDVLDGVVVGCSPGARRSPQTDRD